MALQTLLWDSRIRTLAVLLPAMGVMLWIASELASEDFLVPLAILALFTTLVTFTVFVKTIRFEAAILCLLLVGYLVGNRGFADLAPVKPLYPGELGMLAISSCLLVRFALSRELPDFSGWVARMIFLYCTLGAVRLLIDYDTYRMDAIRDSAMVYYSVYYFFGRQLIKRPETKQILEKCLSFSFLALVPIAFIERFFPDLNWIGTGETNGGYSLLYQKDDLMTTFAAAGVYIIYTNPKLYRWNWVRASLILFYLTLVITGMGRASLAALIVVSSLMLLAGKKRFFLYPAVAVLLGVTVLAGFVVTFGISGTNGATVLVDKVTSMADLSSSGHYSSDFGAMKAGTNDFRRKLWDTFIDETNLYGPWFGHGFGYNFVISFSEIYQLSDAGTLRSAHNFYVTLYGRMGVAGIAVFAVLTFQIGLGGIRSARAVRLGREPLANLGYWCTTWVILVSSVVGVVLEGPVAAIVFWTFLGVAVDASQLAKAAHRESVKEKSLDLLSWTSLPEQRPLAYGVARESVVPTR